MMAFYNLLFFILTWSYVLNAFQLIRSSHESQKFIRSGQLGAPRSLPLRDSMSATLGIDPETVKALNELQGAVSSEVSSGNALIGQCLLLMLLLKLFNYFFYRYA